MKDANIYLKALYIDVKKGLKGYLKSQLIMMLITLVILTVSLKYIGIEYSFLKSSAIAIVDAIPVVGSGIIMAPWALYYLIVGPKAMALKLAIIYVVLTIAKQIIQPKIVGDSIGLSPLYTLLLTLIGSVLLGPLGVVLGPIIGMVIASVLRVRKLLYDETKKNRW